MNKVFVTGATGYIGSSVAQAFRNAGYEVWGLTRSEAKASQLAQQEIHPVLGSMQEPESYANAASQADVLVQAAVDYQNGTAELDSLTVNTLLSIAKPGTVLLYTSGVWVLGNTNGQPVNESAPLAPAKAVAWRPQVEQKVMAASQVRGVALRPGVVYGKSGGLTGLWFSGAANGGVRVVGDGRNRWAMVHVDDLAQAYVLAAENGLGGEVFNLVNDAHATVQEMAAAASKAAGNASPIVHVPVDEAAQSVGDMAEALALDQLIGNQKAVRVLNWRPTHAAFVDETPTYYAAWKASV